MANSNLTNAKNAKNDEFYTQFSDIQKEVEAYLEFDHNTFKGKVIYCNCDDPFESNFFSAVSWLAMAGFLGVDQCFSRAASNSGLAPA